MQGNESALNVHIYPSTFANESRILKIVRSLRGCAVFSHIRVMAVWKDGLPERETLGEGIEVWRVAPVIGGSISGPLGRVLKIFGWYLGVLWALRGQKLACFNCHSLPVLPLSVIVKLWKRCVLVYDPHELETETAGLRGGRQWLVRRTERLLIGVADAVCVVNQSIAAWYSTRYRLNHVWVVRNVPYRSTSQQVRTGLLRNLIGLASDARLFLYQGLLAPGRGIPLLLDAFSRMPADSNMVFMGYGEMEGHVREASKRYPNIHFMPAVAPDRVQDYTVDADVGISLIENVCRSYYLCLPNKLFEYAACGVPAIVSDFPEMSAFVDEFDCGWKVTPDARALHALVLNLNEAEVARKRENTKNSGHLYCWQEEEEKLLAMYEALGFKAGAMSVHQTESEMDDRWRA